MSVSVTVNNSPSVDIFNDGSARQNTRSRRRFEFDLEVLSESVRAECSFISYSYKSDSVVEQLKLRRKEVTKVRRLRKLVMHNKYMYILLFLYPSHLPEFPAVVASFVIIKRCAVKDKKL